MSYNVRHNFGGVTSCFDTGDSASDSANRSLLSVAFRGKLLLLAIYGNHLILTLGTCPLCRGHPLFGGGSAM